MPSPSPLAPRCARTLRTILAATLPAATFLAAALLAANALPAQQPNAVQSVTTQGLRSSAGHGAFRAAAYGPNGNLYFLLDQHDGIRVLELDPTATQVLAETQQGAAGDAGLAMALDPAGNVYVTGTSTSGTLSGTSGSAFPTRADNSTNSFLAKFDPGLHLVFLTFLGSRATAAAAVAATQDAVFVTGITFNPSFPVTAAGLQQAAASGSSENGFVERFSTDGATLVYATYLTGLNGDTIPSSIAADSADNAYIAGTTTSSGFPTFAALVPRLLGGPASGFLTKLNPAGSALAFSTFIPGAGLSSVALDSSTSTLLLAGAIAPGQFPIATVAAPLTSASYQAVARLSTDGQTVLGAALTVPGDASFVTPAPAGGIWLASTLSTPLFPVAPPPDYSLGDTALLRLTADWTFDQTLRFGGQPTSNASYATMRSTPAAPAVAAASVAVPMTESLTLSGTLATILGFDLPLVAAPTAALPGTLRDAVTGAGCGSGQCTVSAGLLSLVQTYTSKPSLGISLDDLPNLTLRNLGSATASGLSLSATGYTLATDCAGSLAPSSQCGLALSGTGPGSLTASSTETGSTTLALPATSLASSPLAPSAAELDFGIVAPAGASLARTLTVTNLSATPQTFPVALDAGASSTAYTLAVSSADCTPVPGTKQFTIAASSACHLTFTLTAASAADLAVRQTWLVGTRDVVLTGFSQAAALNLSSSTVDFGLQYTGASSLRLPRFLYLSNNSAAAVAHTQASLPASSPFTVADACPSVLEPHTVCQLTLGYSSSTAPSADAATLYLDAGLSVQLTGETLPQSGVTGTAANPRLTVSPSSLTFATPVVTSGLSTTTQTVTVTNTGAAAMALTLALSGDFTLVTDCPATLAAGSSCRALLNFAPSQPGDRQGVLSVTGGSGFAPAYVSLSGTALPLLPPNNGSLALGQTYVGEPLVAWYQIQQSLTSLTVKSGNPRFGVVLEPNTGAVPVDVSPSAFGSSASGTCSQCYLGIQFLPTTAGAQTGTLTLSTVAGGNPYPVTLSATALAVQGLLLSPTATDFGPIPRNSASAPQIFVLANLLNPATPAQVQSVSVTGDFSVVSNQTGGPSCSGALATTASCFVAIQFAPTALGQRTGTLTIVTAQGTVTAALSGYGLADPGIAFSPSALTFSNVPNSSAIQQSIQVTNTSAGAIQLGAPLTSDPSFTASSTCGLLAAAATCTVTVVFTPQTATVAASLSLPVTSTVNGQTSTTTYSIPLNGSYTTQQAGLELLPAEVNFGASAPSTVGVTRLFTLNNLTSKPLAIAWNAPRDFPLDAASPCALLPANGSCSFAVDFIPATAGPLTGTLLATGTPSDGSSSAQALTYLQGYGTSSGVLTLSGVLQGVPLSFGQITSGQSTTKTLRVTNTGTVSVTIRRVTSQPPFLASTTCGAALSPGDSCAVTLTYAPLYEVATGVASGPRTDAGLLTLESDALSSPDIVSLTGTAAAITSSSPASSAVLASYAVSTEALTFPPTGIGSLSAPQTVTVTNNGTRALTFGAPVAPSDFPTTSTCATLLPGDTCTLTIAFSPTAGASSAARADVVQLASNGAAALDFISVSGSAGASPLALSPTSVQFGAIGVGVSSTATLTITNPGTSPVTFYGVTASGGFSIASSSCPPNGGTLAAGASCSLTIAITPTAPGTLSGVLSLSTSASSQPLTVQLVATAAASTLSVSPAALSFNALTVGASTTLPLTLTANGPLPITGIAATLSGANSADFTLSTPCPATLQPGASCTAVVTFTPSGTGSRTATLSLASSDPSSPLGVPLSGSGLAPSGAFNLTVGSGANSATATVPSGSPAVFPLTLTPTGGFTGAVALTCAAVNPGKYATCSIAPSTLTLTGGALASTATINTITSPTVTHRGPGLPLGWLTGLTTTPLVALLLAESRRDRRRRRTAHRALVLPLSLALSLAAVSLSGCGGKSAPVTGSSTVLTTPAGNYQYVVTATSTSGPTLTSSVTLNVVVQ